MTDLIQTIATAMRPHINERFDDEVGGAWSATLATAALTAINEAGLVIVPREPTDAMLDAGYDSEDCDGWSGPLSCWERMIRAAITTGETGNG